MPSLASVQVGGMAAFARDLKTMAPKVYTELTLSLKRSAEIMADTARSEASWSTRIPGSIRVSGNTPRTIKIKAGSDDAPHAYTFEAPNGTPVRHPVFGRNTWVAQEPRPFLRPAVEKHTEEMIQLVSLAIDTAFRMSGFH